MRTFAGIAAPLKPPTQRHRPAVWECLLGTVYAMNSEGEIRYFDFDYAAAKAHAGVTPDSDPRLAKVKERVRYGNGADSSKEPRQGQTALWILR